MVEIHIPASLEYNTVKASHLAAALKSIGKIEEIPGWKKQVIAQFEDMNTTLKAIEERQQTASEVISQKQQDYRAKNFLTRIFDGRKEQKKWITEQNRLEREKTQIENVIDQFKSAFDYLPDSHDKVKELLEDCKRQKKELQTEVKNVNANKSSIRAEAKLQKAKTNYGKYGNGERQRIKLGKKIALKTQDDQKLVIKRQNIELDQMIIWLERFE